MFDGIIAYYSSHIMAFCVTVYVLFINLWVFILCGVDKYKAARGKWRVRERTFFALSALGGSVFMLFGMRLFRHKTKHREFTICIPMMLILQIVLIVYLQYRYSLLSQIFIG